MAQLNQEKRIQQFQYITLILFGGLVAASFVTIDQTRFAWTIVLSLLLVIISLTTGLYYRNLKQEFHRFAIGIKDGLDVLGTQEFDTLNHKPVVEKSIDVFQALIEAHKKLESFSNSDNKLQQENLKELESLKRQNITRADYITNMSHELRTPLNSIIGFAEVILNDIEREKYQSIQSDTSKIRQAGIHLLKIVNNILDLARVDAKKATLHLENIDIQFLAQFIYELMTPQFDKKNLKFTHFCEEDLPSIRIDSTRVRQILLNILGNAVKFTDKGEVTFNTRKVFWKNKNYICFSIEDTGSGIPENQLTNIFERFTQIHNIDEDEFEGTGLGLSIARTMVELMGGEIQVESTLNVGSTFRIFIPIENDEDSQISEAAKRILVVDDDSDARETWSEWLTSKGYEVIVAENGAVAFEVFKNTQPDLVITDVIMPGGGGRDLMVNIKGMSPKCPIIAVTGEDIQQEVATGKLTTVDKVFLKPFDLNKLSDAVASYLGQP